MLKKLNKLHKQWQYSSKILNLPQSLGAKYHYLHHAVEYVSFWGFGIGSISEQSIDAFQKTTTKVFNRYKNQRGTLRIKYGMRQLLFITSPLYQ